MAKITTISVTRALRDEIASLGHKDERFEDILKRLLKKYGEENE